VSKFYEAYFAKIFQRRNAFSIGRSEHRSNEASGPIVAVKSSNDMAIGSGYMHKVAKCRNPQFSPKTKMGSMRF